MNRLLHPNHPDHHYETIEARMSLAAKLGLPYSDLMQDWEYEVAEPSIYAPLMTLYRQGSLDEDERFSAGMIFVQIVADLGDEQGTLPPEWSAVVGLLLSEPRLHAATVSYWALFGEGHEWAHMGAEMRSLWPKVSQALSIE